VSDTKDGGQAEEPEAETSDPGVVRGAIVVQEEEEEEEERVASELSGKAAPQSVFISYRVVPDEPIAGALKELVEACLNPAPHVFVSGLGGILPSEKSAKLQMQQAARGAGAFIAVITKNSLDREWIFFEAGAAWGRDVLYAPMLVGVEPEMLPNTINSYQALDYRKEDKVRELLREVASRVGARVRTKAFPRRYPRFADRVAEQVGQRRPAEGKDRPHDFGHALDLIFEGTEAADRKLDAFDATDPELKANLPLWRIILDQRVSVADRLERLGRDEKLVELRPYHIECAELETAPHRALAHAQEHLRLYGGPDDNPYGIVRALSVAQTSLRALGRSAEADNLLRAALADRRRVVRAEAVLRLAASYPAATASIERAALVAFAAATHPASDVLDRAARLLHQTGLTSLSLHVARLAEEAEKQKDKSASANHWMGLAYSSAGLKSLAYLKYKAAAAGGVSVGRLNMAQLLADGPVPSAGLDALDAQVGAFDAASPASPHSARARIEEKVQAERDAGDELLKIGRAVFGLLVEAVESALNRSDGIIWSDDYQMGSEVFHRTLQSATSSRFESEKFKFSCAHDQPVRNLTTIASEDRRGLLVPLDGGRMRLVWIDPLAQPTALEFSPAPARALAVASNGQESPPLAEAQTNPSPAGKV
jgi:hypothetical protein